ncbi:MAG: type II CAAX endopeptidase family protein [Pseudomonadota bacterium]
MTSVQPGERQLGIGGWGFGFGLLAIAVAFMLASVVYVLILMQVLGLELDAFLTDPPIENQPVSTVGLLITFFGMILGVWVAIRLILRRQFSLLIWSNISTVFGDFLKTTAGYAVIVGILSATAIFAGSMVPNVPFDLWIRWAPLVFVLVLVQVTAEELVFRGYLQRILMDWSKSRLVWMVIPSVAFGALHYQSEIFGPNAWLVVVATSIFGFVAAELTYRSNSIGPAIGFHFVNNVNAMLITQMDAGVGGMALFKTPYSTADVDAVRTALIQSSVLFCALFVLVWFFWPRRTSEKFALKEPAE